MPSTRLVRTTTFSAAHRYFNPKLSDSENRKLYGSLYREQGFGHNFVLEAHFEGAIDSVTGMIINLKDVDQILKQVTEKLDHRHLNDLGFFSQAAPTPELIASVCFQEITTRLEAARLTPQPQLVQVRLYEGDALWVDCFTE